MTMRFGSVCSGIEAASVAWHPLGWTASWFAEIEPFPSAVLAHHYPEVPNLGDMTTIGRRVLTGEVDAPDILCGGTPCQAFSVAGLRESLDDDRGNLTLKFVGLADAIDYVRTNRGDQPSIVFWENVPGVLSTKDNAFGCFLAGLAGEDDALQPPGGKWANAGAVYGPQRAVAWRTLDAQYFGVAQRRRRVFVVASAREGFDPATVLFEFDGVRRDTAPSRESGETVTPTIRAGAANGGAGHGARSGDSKDELIVPVCPTLRAGGNKTGGDRPPGTDVDTADSLIPVLPFDTTQITSTENRSNPQPGDPCHPLATGAHAPAVAFMADDYKDGTFEQCDAARPLTTSADRSRSAPIAATAMQVRRLTPAECEKLQGFPPGYTLIPWRKKPADECPDGPRYKALGNSWAVPNVRWIGRRIESAVTNSNSPVR